MYDICIYEELTNLDRLIVLTISLLLIIFIGSVDKKKNKSFLKDTKTGRLKMIERKAEKNIYRRKSSCKRKSVFNYRKQTSQKQC